MSEEKIVMFDEKHIFMFNTNQYETSKTNESIIISSSVIRLIQ